MNLLLPDTTLRSASVFATRNSDGTYCVVAQFSLNGGVHTQVSSPPMTREEADMELVSKHMNL